MKRYKIYNANGCLIAEFDSLSYAERWMKANEGFGFTVRDSNQ